MATTTDDVLKALNMKSTEFEASTLSTSLNSAQVRVDARVRGHIIGPIYDEAVLRLATYLAYSAYCDNPKNRLPGKYDSITGVFTPVNDPEARINMATKLESLKNISDEAIDDLISASNIPRGKAPAFGAIRIK